MPTTAALQLAVPVKELINGRPAPTAAVGFSSVHKEILVCTAIPRAALNN
jgi:hypothetical protein